MIAQIDGDILKIKSSVERELELLDIEFVSLNEAYGLGFIPREVAEHRAAILNGNRELLEGKLLFLKEMAA